MPQPLYKVRELELARRHFINSYPPFNVAKRADPAMLDRKQDISLYVHIPFCRTICTYCYYKRFGNPSEGAVTTYLDHLEKEIELYSRQAGGGGRIQTLYIGGGTPTVLTTGQLRRLVSMLRTHFSLGGVEEFCCEMVPHPEPETAEKLAALKELGVHRISFGVESFNEGILRMHNRHCTRELYERTYAAVCELGFDNINIDMMSGLPGETWDNWVDTIETLLSWRPPSISIYKTEIFYNTTTFTRMRRGKNAAPLMSDEEEIRHIRYAHDTLRKRGGYAIANCLHLVRDWKYDTLHYRRIWEGNELKGLGLSSHSCCRGLLHQNASELGEYYSMLDSGQLPIKRIHKMSARDRISQAMVYGLKNLAVNREDFAERFGVDFTILYSEVIDQLLRVNAVTLDDQWLRITPQHYIFTDDICRQFFLPEYSNMMMSHVERPSEQAMVQVTA